MVFQHSYFGGIQHDIKLKKVDGTHGPGRLKTT